MIVALPKPIPRGIYRGAVLQQEGRLTRVHYLAGPWAGREEAVQMATGIASLGLLRAHVDARWQAAVWLQETLVHSAPALPCEQAEMARVLGRLRDEDEN